MTIYLEITMMYVQCRQGFMRYGKCQKNKISDLATLKTIYHSLIQSHLPYGVLTYGGTFQQNLEKN